MNRIIEDRTSIKGDKTILFLTNNENAMNLYYWLEEVEKTVLLFQNKLDMNYVRTINPDFIISYSYSYIITEEIIELMCGKIINLHISLLPWNKGSNPNYWSFIDNTPKGVTIHLIDKGLDTGKVLAQKEVYFDEENESFRSSYDMLHNTIQQLFIDNWENIKNNSIIPVEQKGLGSVHNMSEFRELTERFPVDWNDIIARYKQRMLKEVKR